MTSKVLNLLLLGVVMLTALACSLSDDDAATPTVDVSGDIDQSALGKPLSAASTSILTVVVVNSSGTVIRTGTITGSTYTIEVNQGQDQYIELRFSDDTVFLSKFLSSTETDTTTAITAPVDTISHYLAKALKAADQNDLAGSWESILIATFGSVAAYSPSSTAATLIAIIQTENPSLASNLIQISIQIATTPITGSSDFTQIDNNFDSTVAEEQDTVTFSAPTLSAKAAPGVVYTFNPGATSSAGSLDSDGPYVVTVSAGAGSVAVDADNDLIKYIPDAADINSTVTLSVNAIGALGGSNLQSVSITVTDLEITGKDEYRLSTSGSGPYQVVAGPMIDGDYLYVVSNDDGVYTIEKYTLADFSVTAGDTSPSAEDVTVVASNWTLPEAFSDMIIKSDVAYVVDSNTGVVKYDLTATGTTGFSSVTETNFTASTLALAGTTLLAFNSQNQTFASLDTSSSSADVASAISDLWDETLTASDIGSFGNYFYVSGTNVSNVATVEFYNSSLAYVDSFTSDYTYDFIEDVSGLSDSLYGVSNATATVVALSFSGSEVIASTFSTSTAGTVADSNFEINGSTLITNNYTDTTYAFSLTSGNTATSTENNTSTVDLDFLVDLSTLIVNIPEGASTLDAAGDTSNTTHAFVPAKANTTSLTSSYYIKAYELTAED
jgi:hypothetical protein